MLDVAPRPIDKGELVEHAAHAWPDASRGGEVSERIEVFDLPVPPTPQTVKSSIPSWSE